MRIDRAGNVSVYVTGIDRPRFPLFDKQGNLYVASYDGGIYKFSPSKRRTTVASAIWSPRQMGFDGQGNLYVAGAYDGKIYQVYPYKRVLASGFNQPYLLAVETDGTLYVVDANHQGTKIIKVFRGNKSIYASFNEKITGMTLYNGNLYVSHGNKVSRISYGRISTIVSNLKQPSCLTVHNNKLFVSTANGIFEVSLK